MHVAEVLYSGLNYSLLGWLFAHLLSLLSIIEIHSSPTSSLKTNYPVGFLVSINLLIIVSLFVCLFVCQWRVGGHVIQGASGDHYTVPSAKPTDSGNYTCIASNSRGKVNLTRTVIVQGEVHQYLEAISCNFS